MIPICPDTKQLVQLALDGDRVAIDRLYAVYRQSLCRMVAVRMDTRLRARFDPSDIVQMAFANVLQGVSSMPPTVEAFYPWLRQQTMDQLARVHRDHIRTEKRSIKREVMKCQSECGDAVTLHLAGHLSESSLWPGSQLAHQELRSRVRQALDQLADTDREVLVLRFLERLTISDVSALLDISESAVKSRQYRAIEHLREFLDRHPLRGD